MSTDEFLRYLSKFGLNIGKSDLFDIVKKEPLSNIIQNVNKDQVTFKGQQGAEELAPKPDVGDSEKIRQQMAKKAMN